ncbi:Phosphatidylinositol3,4,5-trisphosphate-dependent Rac exchanger 1 protein, partial [Monoraphidium neglectum]
MERSCSQQQFVMEMPMEELVEISEAMRDGLQGRIKDRTHRLRTYRRCFPGAAGVRWLVESGHAAGDEQAVALGNAMLQAGLLRHVAYEHTFKNTQLLYKFTSDDEGGPLLELSASRPASCRQSETGTPRLEGAPPDGLASAASMPGSLHSRLPRFTPPAPGGGSSFAHRALLNAQVHSLNQKLERLASQHATLLAANAQQQEVWEGQASSDLREVKEAIGQLAGALAATQEQVLQLVSQASSTHGLLSSQRAVSAVQQLIMALAMLALGTGWAPPALWALAAAAAGALAVVLMDWGADDARERRAAAQEQLAAQRLSARGLAARLSGGGGGGGLPPLITSLQGERLGQRNGGGGAKLGAGGDVVGGAAPGGVCVVASTSTGSTASEGGSDAPPPMAREAEALLVGRVMGGKLLEDTAPALEEFEGWPDGDVILRPTPKSSDLAVTRVTRYASPSHVAVPTELHARWEADQAPYTDAADDDVDEQQQQARRDSGGGGGESGGWVPQPGAGLPLNQYVIHFESDLFVGKMLSYIKGLPSSHEPYFTGKKRRS